jgi:hypothetical protein
MIKDKIIDYLEWFYARGHTPISYPIKKTSIHAGIFIKEINSFFPVLPLFWIQYYHSGGKVS